MSEHKAKEIRFHRTAHERKMAIDERTGLLAIIAALLHDDDAGSAVASASVLLAAAKKQAEHDVDADAAGEQ